MATANSSHSLQESHAFRRVEWCLRKAERELKEIGSHRGLIRRQPDERRAGQHIAKAEHNLYAALYFREGGFSDWSASAFFYCIYHCFLAILTSRGYESRNQECTLAAIDMLSQQGSIAIEGRFVDALRQHAERSLIALREQCQYDILLEFSETAEMGRLTALCQEMLDLTRDIVHARPQGKA